MKNISTLLLFMFVGFYQVQAQHSFDYSIKLEPTTLDGIAGLHSYVYGQHEGKWLIIGGRRDGLHARQPFAAFAASGNNDTIYVADVSKNKVWTAPLSALSDDMQEQLQSTNMSFHQIEDTLYIVGGYGYSNQAADHITYPFLTTVQVSSLIDDVITSSAIESNFKQIEDTIFQVCGGQLDKIGSTFYLVGGQDFQGRYNPMGHNTYTQSYTNQIRKFNIDNSGSNPSVLNHSVITDPVHLRRRDYNLLPQIFPNGEEGLMISSGVFQPDVDLPFLYPVEIRDTSYKPITQFNQYLSNYHSAKTSLFDSLNNEMHMIFYGGISQYYYKDTVLIKDDKVPFVNTISRLSRSSSGELKEFQMETKMPLLNGAGAEFIPNHALPLFSSEIIKLSRLEDDTTVIGHIVGGISSPSLNPFADNQSNTTSANVTVYKVTLIKDKTASVIPIDGSNPYSVTVSPNPFSTEIHLNYISRNGDAVLYYITSVTGQVIQQGTFSPDYVGEVNHRIVLKDDVESQPLFLTLEFDSKYFVTKALIKY